MNRLLLLVLACCACAPETDRQRAEKTAPYCDAPQSVGPLPDELREASGVAVSRRHPGVLWVHNDGGEPILFAIDTLGQVRARIAVNARNGDWEDIAAGPCGNTDCLYIGAIGDNLQNRSDRLVYRIPEPDLAAQHVEPNGRFHYRLPTGPQDVEALFVLPDERMFLISKGRRGPITLFAFPQPASDTVTPTLTAVQTLTTGLVQLPEMVTGAGATPDGRTIVIRTYSAMQLYSFDGAQLVPLLPTTGLDLQPLQEFQGEGADISANGTVYLVGEQGLEGEPPPLSKVLCTLSEP